MYKLVTVTEMKDIEQAADAGGLTYDQMLQNAGIGVASVAKQRFSTPASALGLIGSGNNGGDTLVALTDLLRSGWQATAWLVTHRPANDTLLEAFQNTGGVVIPAEEDSDFTKLDASLEKDQILMDGVLGTGARLPLSSDIARPLEHICKKAQLPFIIAIDCPTGIDCDTGAAAPETLPANLTICMAAIKTGLLRFPAFERCGEFEVVDIGLPADQHEWTNISRYVVSANDICPLLPARPLNAHKGSFGTVMVVAGSINYTGAALLAGKAAYRSGAGLVRMAIPGLLHTALSGHLPEATWVLLPHADGVIAENAFEVVLKNLSKVTCLLIGPGLGTEDTTAAFLRRLLSPVTGKGSKGQIGFVGATPNDKAEKQLIPPMVIDADGLQLLAHIPNWPQLLTSVAVLTPHPGEMAALTGKSPQEIQENRLDIAHQFATQWQHVIILKGANTVIAAPDGRTAVIPISTPALARAGTGDVLAGLVAGLRAQGVAPFEAALAATYIHAQAGLDALRHCGHSASVLASDVLYAIPQVLKSL